MERVDCTDVEGMLADGGGSPEAVGGARSDCGGESPQLYFVALFGPLCGGAI